MVDYGFNPSDRINSDCYCWFCCFLSSISTIDFPLIFASVFLQEGYPPYRRMPPHSVTCAKSRPVTGAAFVLLGVRAGDGVNQNMGNNIVFRGLIVAMFTIILGLTGYIVSQLDGHLSNIDASIGTLNNNYGTLTYRVIRLEDKLKP